MTRGCAAGWWATTTAVSGRLSGGSGAGAWGPPAGCRTCPGNSARRYGRRWLPPGRSRSWKSTGYGRSVRTPTARASCIPLPCGGACRCGPGRGGLRSAAAGPRRLPGCQPPYNAEAGWDRLARRSEPRCTKAARGEAEPPAACDHPGRSPARRSIRRRTRLPRTHATPAGDRSRPPWPGLSCVRPQPRATRSVRQARPAVCPNSSRRRYPCHMRSRGSVGKGWRCKSRIAGSLRTRSALSAQPCAATRLPWRSSSPSGTRSSGPTSAPEGNGASPAVGMLVVASSTPAKPAARRRAPARHRACRSRTPGRFPRP
jgi:hypothetical protein